MSTQNWTVIVYEWFQAFDKTGQELQFKTCIGLAVACDKKTTPKLRKNTTKMKFPDQNYIFF